MVMEHGDPTTKEQPQPKQKQKLKVKSAKKASREYDEQLHALMADVYDMVNTNIASPTPICPTCGEDNVKPKGHRRGVLTGEKPQYECLNKKCRQDTFVVNNDSYRPLFFKERAQEMAIFGGKAGARQAMQLLKDQAPNTYFNMPVYHWLKKIASGGVLTPTQTVQTQEA